MTLNQQTLGQWIAFHQDLVRVLLVVAVVSVVMIAMSFAFPLHQVGPWLVLPDPANGVGMPS
jgi:hypothetical protein